MELTKNAHASNPALTVPLGQPLPPPTTSTSTSLSTPSRSKRDKPKPAVHLIAGGLGGMCGSVVTAPFDVVKTRLQSDLFQQRSTKQITRQGIKGLLYNFVDTGKILRDVYKHEGPTALFKGLGPTLAGVVPGRSINFFVYGNGKHLYAEWFNDGKENTFVHLASAATAGVVTAAATNPIWVIKTVMQLQQQERSHSSPSSSSTRPSSSSLPRSTPRPLPVPPNPHSSPHFSHSFRSLTSPPLPLASPPPRPTSYSTTLQIYRTEGIRGFYKGLSASLLGVTEGTIQWSLYEQFKKIAKAEQIKSNGTTGGGGEATEGWRVSMAAGMAKLVATVITYPHEVIRTRLRQPPPASGIPKYTSLVQSFNLILREESWKALYGGMSPHLLRVVPNAVTMFWVYEKCLLIAERKGMVEKMEAEKEGRIASD
ncbi:hypothetical protein JCM5353_000550 [Sporobolomyces roseus]